MCTFISYLLIVSGVFFNYFFMLFKGDGTNCSDVNECDSSPCDGNASCGNTDGGFTCSCNSGYSGILA